MASLTPTFWLTKAQYLESKKMVVLEFSKHDCRQSVCFQFFPELLVPKSVSLAKLKEFVSECSSRRFRVFEEPNCFRVVASSFSELLELNSVLEEYGVFVPLLSPERQFLVLKNWSFFDSFRVADGTASRVSGFSLPECLPGFFSSSVFGTVSDLLSSSREAGVELARKIVFSSVFCVPLQDVSSVVSPVDFFLENLLFRNRFGIFLNNFSESNVSTPAETIASASEIDFSFSWAELLARDRYNIGFETVDCSCCVPDSIFGVNVLPNSLVECEFLVDGLFFDSVLPDFARYFHDSSSGKESREKRRKDFCLQNFPIGPFFRLDRKPVPVIDALALVEKKEARIMCLDKAHWYCLKKESFVASALRGLFRRLERVKGKILVLENSANSRHGLFFSHFLDSSPDFVFALVHKSVLESIVRSLPRALSDSSARFFFFPLAFSLQAVQHAKINSFRQLVSEKGQRTMQLSNEKALVFSNSALELVSEFSEKEKLSSPMIAFKGQRKSS